MIHMNGGWTDDRTDTINKNNDYTLFGQQFATYKISMAVLHQKFIIINKVLK